MKKSIGFILNTMGWLMLIFVMLMASLREVGLNPQLYFDLQMEAGILQEAGISEDDLLKLDVALARYLGGKQTAIDYRIEVFGRQVQPPFNAREMRHLADCRTLFAPVTAVWFNIALAIIAAALIFCNGGWRTGRRAVWLASAIFMLPIAVLGIWAAVDFPSAFTFFHRILFTNDLWLLNPETDLLIRICPQSMFANMGLRIAVRSAAVLLGLSIFFTFLYKLEQRKRKTT